MFLHRLEVDSENEESGSFCRINREVKQTKIHFALNIPTAVKVCNKLYCILLASAVSWGIGDRQLSVDRGKLQLAYREGSRNFAKQDETHLEMFADLKLFPITLDDPKHFTPFRSKHRKRYGAQERNENKGKRLQNSPRICSNIFWSLFNPCRPFVLEFSGFPEIFLIF